MLEDIKKYDLLTIELKEGVIRNCLVYNVMEFGITIYPIQQLIDDVDFPRAIAKVFISKERIVDLKKDNLRLLFYALNTQHRFTRDAIEYHMNSSSN